MKKVFFPSVYLFLTFLYLINLSARQDSLIVSFVTCYHLHLRSYDIMAFHKYVHFRIICYTERVLGEFW